MSEGIKQTTEVYITGSKTPISTKQFQIKFFLTDLYQRKYAACDR